MMELLHYDVMLPPLSLIRFASFPFSLALGQDVYVHVSVLPSSCAHNGYWTWLMTVCKTKFTYTLWISRELPPPPLEWTAQFAVLYLFPFCTFSLITL